MKKWEGIEIEFQEGAFWFWLFALSEFYYRSSWLDHSRIKSVMLYWEILRPIHFCFCWILVIWKKMQRNQLLFDYPHFHKRGRWSRCLFFQITFIQFPFIKWNSTLNVFSGIRHCKGIGVPSDSCILGLKISLIRMGEMNAIFYQAFTPLGASAPDFSGFLIFILHTVKNAYFQDN